MEGTRSNAAAFASTTITSDDASAADQIRRCLRDARKLEEKRRNDQLPLPPKIRDELLEESFSKLRPEQGMAKELTAEEFVTLQNGLGKLIRSDMKEKMVLLQDQLSEYHSILEEVIALKSRCERLEQDKKDLVSFYRRACQDRDHKIMLLENELARSRFCSSSSDEASSVIGSGSEGRYYLHSHDQLRHYHHSQELSAPAFFPPRMPPGISNEHCHHYHHHNESARMYNHLRPPYRTPEAIVAVSVMA